MGKFKKFALVFCAVCLALVGCNSNDTSSDGGNSDSGGPDENVTINFAAISSFGADSWSDLIKKFEAEHPNIKVNLQELPPPSNSTEVHQYLVTALQSGQSDIDVFTGDVIWVPEFAAAGWTEPMDDHVDKDAYYPGVIDALTYDGQLMAVPWYVDGGMLYYRTDLLEKYDKPVPETWDELMETAEFITESENNDDLQGFVWQGKQAEVLVCNFIEFLHSAGGSVLNENEESTIDSAATVEALNFMRDTVTEGISPQSVLTFDEDPSRTVFTDGNAVFHRNWSFVWAVAQNEDQSNIAGNVGIAPLPSFEGGESSSTMGGYQYMVAKNSQQKEAAIQFANFLSNEESQLYFATELAYSPTRPAVLEDEGLQETSPFLVELNDVFRGTTARPVSPVYPQISLQLQANVSAVLSDQMSPEDFVKTMDTEISNIVQQ